MRRILHSLVLMIPFVTLVIGCQAMTGQTAGELTDDTVITTGVKSKLATDELATLSRIEVETVNGTVHLTGVVASEEHKSRAEAITREVDGVTNVVNGLQVE